MNGEVEGGTIRGWGIIQCDRLHRGCGLLLGEERPQPWQNSSLDEIEDSREPTWWVGLTLTVRYLKTIAKGRNVACVQPFIKQ